MFFLTRNLRVDSCSPCQRRRAILSVKGIMNQTLEAVFDGKVFRPVGAVELEPNTTVEIVITVKSAPEEKTKSFLRTARSLKLQGPKDFSTRIDDYLNGEASLLLMN